jgi:hypothetical protein
MQVLNLEVGSFPFKKENTKQTSLWETDLFVAMWSKGDYKRTESAGSNPTKAFVLRENRAVML